MYTVVGSGFGLYGYLPALVESLGETVALPRAYEEKVRARPELARALEGVRWFADADEALAAADAVVIATPPARQVEVARRCIAASRVRRLVLEKPLAPAPADAQALLTALAAAGKRVRVGYTLLKCSWYPALAWAARDAGPVSIEWTFMAHHFAHGLANWKRSAREGGGVLRFFGIHVVALLAQRGYTRVGRSTLEGDSPDEPQAWRAAFSGDGLPDCDVRVDSRSSSRAFRIACAGDRAWGVRMADPFEAETAEGGADRRVGVLGRLLRSFDQPDAPFEGLYARTNDLWRQAEAA